VKGRRTGLASSILLAVVSLTILFGGCGDDNPGRPQPEPCAMPTFDPAPGSYARPVTVTILCETAGAVIRYTVDGSEPTEESQRYSHSFAIPTSLTIKARAWKDGFLPSEVASGTYTITCAIDVTAPTGGEALPVGEPYTISWTSTVCTGSVLIELLLNEAVCDTIAADAVDSGGFIWNVQDCDGQDGEYRIRVTNIMSGASDQSDGFFSIITPCRIAMDSPVGGETWQAGTAHEIHWSATGACGTGLRVELLLDGVACRTIASAATGDNLSWEAAQCGERTSGYRVRVFDPLSGASAESEGTLSILSSPCQLTVTSPAGGESWQVQTDHEITWSSTDCSSLVRIDLLRDGAPCSTLAEATENDGSFLWRVAWCDATINGYKIRITDTGTASSSESGGPFSIVPSPCFLDLTSPDGGEEWTQGTEQTISWTSSECADSVRIELLAAGVPCKVIASSTPNDGSFPWIVERCVSEGGYRVRITDLGYGNSGVSAAAFSIHLPSCQIALTSPNGGESWQEGTDHEITWSTIDCFGDIRIELLRDGQPCSTLVEHAPDTGRYPWNPMRCGTEESGYSIRLTDLWGNRSDASDSLFSIPAPPPCRPLVTAPGAGDRWVVDTSEEIRWQPSACDALVRIELLKEGVVCRTISNTAPNTGRYPWTVQQCALSETGYKIRVTGIQSGESGESEQTFSIPQQCALAMIYPVGGESLGAGSSLRWSRIGACGSTVRLELLRNDLVCAIIADETANDGAFGWNAVPCGGEEDGYKIRVTDPESGVSADSPEAFSIPGCRLQVTSPNGGEAWRLYDYREIRWTTTGCGETVSIELLREGTLCRTISSSTENDGSFNWVVESRCENEDGYTIRVTDTGTGRTDESDAPFTIPHCFITLLSPIGGESFTAGSEQTIAWSSSGSACASLVDVYLGCGHLGHHELLAEDAPGTGSIVWTARTHCGDPCEQLIIIVDKYGLGIAESGFFCVCPPCQIAVTSPNGGETWKKSTSHDITWNSTDCAESVLIELLRTGDLCRVIADATPDDGRFTWTADNCGPSSGYSIRVTGPCGVSDTSNAVFSIPECSLSLTSPNGGERWIPGSQQTITWNSTICGDLLRISLMENGGLCQTIVANAPNNGSFTWTVQTCDAVGCNYKVRLTDLETNKIEESAAPFCVCPPCVPTVSSPNGGESWEEGTAQEIRWDPVAGCDANVKLELIRSNAVCLSIAPSTPNDGSFIWTAQRCQGQTDGYKVRVTGISCLQQDESDQAFQIPPAPCRLGIVSPNGGEEWTASTSHEITWNPTGECSGNVKLDLLQNGSVCAPIAASTPNDGSYTWAVARCGALEADYSIRVMEPISGATDLSDQSFSIPLCEIAVTSPAGGERWQEGTPRTLTWTSSHCTGTVRIELLRNDVLCRTITAGTPDDGSFEWTAANCDDVEGGHKIRIVDAMTGASGTSGVFSLPEPPCVPTVNAPNGGERWAEATQHSITWSSVACGAAVKIDLLRNGVACRTIADSTANDGSLLWTAQRCGVDTTGYAIQITDRRSGAHDESNQVFTIPCPACPVAVASPNGGESWQEGTPRQITWSPPGCDSAVKIELLQNGSVCRTIAAAAADNGSFTWTPERCGAPSSGYAIRITGLTCGRKDQSNQSFSIVPIPDLFYFPKDLQICAGQQGVEIPIYGRNSQAIKGYGVSLCFDPAVFECVDIVKEGTRGEGGSQFVRLCQPGCARAGLVYSSACPPQIEAGEGILLKLIVNVKPGAPAGPTQLDLVNVDPAYNTTTLCNGSPLDPVLQDGTVQICITGTSVPGDRGTR
jgi:hypothetical protein